MKIKNDTKLFEHLSFTPFFHTAYLIFISLIFCAPSISDQNLVYKWIRRLIRKLQMREWPHESENK